MNDVFNINDSEDDMARLSYDALVLQANLGALTEMSINEIAVSVFGGGSASKPSNVSVIRATRAARTLVALKRADPLPSKRNITSIRSCDKTGQVQAEAIMNMVVRQGYERRCTERREAARVGVDERRLTEESAAATIA